MTLAEKHVLFPIKKSFFMINVKILCMLDFLLEKKEKSFLFYRVKEKVIDKITKFAERISPAIINL